MKQSFIRALKQILNIIPIIISTILLVTLVTIVIPDSFYVSAFRYNVALDAIIGSLIGSISAGSPIVSYILGGELLEKGVNLIAVTAFLVSWVTVGIIQMPAESAILGKRFAIIRNMSSFVLSILVAIITVLIFNAIK